MLANQTERMSLFLVTSSSCTGHSSCASAVKFQYMGDNIPATKISKFYGPYTWTLCPVQLLEVTKKSDILSV